ncbi:MAG: RHS repeat-associated core domain-containing protein, partial [Phycisphaerae bacterium]
WLFGLAMAMLVIAFFIPAIVHILIRMSGRDPAHMPLSLKHRCLSVLIAYVMLISPAGFEKLAEASVNYSELGVSSWGAAGDVISYCYDANGSLVYKFYADVDVETYSPEYIIANNPTVAYEHHIYNLQNRLARLEKYDDTHTLTDVVGYVYNDDGIRVKKIDDLDGSPIVTAYLTDPFNHTGYAQTLEEDADGVLKTYTIGDDMLSQAVGSGTANHLLYDGHGSTRQLVSGSAGSTSIVDDFSYDGYGVLLQDEMIASANPGKVSTQAASLLYAGEHFDFNAQQYYNRARWYNPLIGLFNQVDPYAGNLHDPQSLHKYLYCHANPINAIDPSGKFATMTEVSFSVSTMTTMQLHMSIAATAILTKAALQLASATKVTAARLHARVISEEDLDKREGGYVYFVHGTNSEKWIFSTGISAEGRSFNDFGPGFYTFPLTDPRSVPSATKRAYQSGNFGIGQPILIVVRYSLDRYNSLSRKDLMSDTSQWYNVVKDYRTWGRISPMGYDEVFGWTAKLRGGIAINHNLPIQHKFEQTGINKGMQIFGILPLPQRYQQAGF